MSLLSTATSYCSYDDIESQTDVGVSKQIAWFVGASIPILIMTTLAILMIVIGATCSCSEREELGIWLIVKGSATLLIILVLLCRVMLGFQDGTQDGTTVLILLLGSFLIVWLAYGSELFISDPRPAGCSKLLYDFVKGYIITMWTIIGLGVVCAICTALITS